jgi:hypothetical protein
MKISALALAAAVGLAIAAPASAAQYTFDFSGTDLFHPSVTFDGSGVFTTSDTATQVGGETAFAITGVTGTFNGSAFVPSASGAYGNYFTTGPTFLDGTGVVLNTAAGNIVDFFHQDFGSYRVNLFGVSGGAAFVTASSSAVAAAVPEPATWAMMLMGLGALGAILRRRRLQQPATTLA